MKRKLLLAALSVVSALGFNAKAQTDVTDTYLTNADFSQGTVASTDIYGYGKDGNPYGLQPVEGWSTHVLSGDNSNATYPNSGMGGAIFQYGSSYMLRGKEKTAPATNPNGDASGNCLGFFAVWGCGGYYYQDVTLQAGSYTITIPVYNAIGTQSNTSYIGFIPDEGDSYTVATNPGVEKWTEQKVSFVLTKDTKGKIALGYQSAGGGSDANGHLFFDGVTLTYKSFSDFEEPALDKRTDIGGVTVDLNDFNVGTEDYTLEVQGTVGEEINIAAENITYTPTVNGLVRFVKHDGLVYAYEGAEYMGLVLSEKAAYTYANSLTTDDPETNNLLQNPSFETLGSLKSGSKYNIGEPWKWRLVNVGDIRIDYNTGKAKHGVSVLVWRGSGNDSYFSQEVASIKPYKGYKVYVSQVDGGNANADFIVGLGNAAGGYANSSKNERFGTNQNKIHEIELVNNSVSGGYFTFRNTSNNTASSGSDPVAQIDWIGMVPSDAFAITGATSAVVLYGAAYAPAAVDDAKVALLAKIEEAKAVDVTTNVGTGAFQIPESAVTTLTEAIASAQGVYDSSSDIEEVEGATATLNSAIEEYKNVELNAPVADKKYKMINVTSADFNFTGNAVIYRYNASAEGKYDLSYDTKESINYAQGFTFTPTAERNVYTLSFESENGETLYICTGAEYTAGRNDRIRVTTNPESTNILTVEIIATSKEGVWNLKNIKGNALIGSNGKDDAGFYTSNARADFKLVEAEKATVSGSLAAGKYATRIFPFIPELPEGVKAYTFGGVEEGNVITLNTVDNPTANVPYILENTSSNEVDITLSGYGLAKQDVYTADGLIGSFAESTVVPAGNYVLQTLDNGQKFYRVGEVVEETDKVKMPAYRAYLTIDNPAGVKAFSFGGETTGINGVETLTDGAVESIYTINGTRVNSLQKGLNIVKMSNGKTQKVLVK